MADNRVKPPLDGGYGWVIVMSCTLLMFMASCTFVALGVFLLELVETFHVSNAEVVMIWTCMVTISGVIGIFSGLLVRQFGCKGLTVICGVISAAGSIASAFAPNVYTLYVTKGCAEGLLVGAVGVTTMVPITQYFDKRKGLAMSLRTMGSGLGAFVWPPLVQFLVAKYTWRGAMLVIGGLQLNVIALGLLLIPPPGSNRTNNKTKWQCTLKTFFDYTLLKDLVFLFFTFSFVATVVGHTVPFNFLPSLARIRGVSASNSAWLVSIIGICSCVARPLYGILADKARKIRVHLYALSVLITGAVIIVTSQLRSFTMFAIFSGAFGLFNSNYMVLMFTILSDIVPPHQMATAAGLVGSVVAAVSLATSSLAGWMVDATKSFGTPFIAYGALQMSASIFVGIMALLQRVRKKNETIKENIDLKEELKNLNSPKSPDEEDEISVSISVKTSS